jgi:hypothetical protein
VDMARPTVKIVDVEPCETLFNIQRTAVQR